MTISTAPCCKGSIVIGSACGKCPRCKEGVLQLLENGWVTKLVKENKELRLKVNTESNKAIANDIRAQGWSVAVHNDYRLNGVVHTFWLFTHPDGYWVKGEGSSDTEALDKCRDAIRSFTNTISVLDAEK